jgi:hypothetical protein
VTEHGIDHPQRAESFGIIGLLAHNLSNSTRAAVNGVSAPVTQWSRLVLRRSLLRFRAAIRATATVAETHRANKPEKALPAYILNS